MKRHHCLSIAGAFLCGGLLTMPALALDNPTEKTVLTVSGKIGETNTGNTARFDMKMIEAMPQHSFTTATPWSDQPQKFTGPLLADVLAAVKAKGTTIEATAINDYRIAIPVADAAKYPIILARLIDGEAIAVRKKGPLFVVYPFDSSDELRTSVFYERAIWQLKSMEIQ